MWCNHSFFCGLHFICIHMQTWLLPIVKINEHFNEMCMLINNPNKFGLLIEVYFLLFFNFLSYFITRKSYDFLSFRNCKHESNQCVLLKKFIIFIINNLVSYNESVWMKISQLFISFALLNSRCMLWCSCKVYSSITTCFPLVNAAQVCAQFQAELRENCVRVSYVVSTVYLVRCWCGLIHRLGHVYMQGRKMSHTTNPLPLPVIQMGLIGRNALSAGLIAFKTSSLFLFFQFDAR